MSIHFRFFLQHCRLNTVFNMKNKRNQNVSYSKTPTMKLNKKLTGLLLIIPFSVSLSAQNEKCNITKTLPVKNGTSLSLSNKYGDVNCITGKDDSISICATITIVQDNEILLHKNLNLINISIEKSGDTIKVETEYDKKFFSESYREGRKSFNVDYLVKIPVYLNMSITSEFGNVSLEELSGIVNLRVSQGLLSARKLSRGNEKPVSSIYVDHGKISIDESNWLTMTVYNCPSVNIGKAQALMIKSTISKIRTGEINSIIIDSKSDNYNIGSINNIIIESAYSTFEIGRLTRQLKSKTTYGSINISDLKKGFSKIDIVSDLTQVLINTGTNASFIADIITIDSNLEFPSGKYPGILRSESYYSTTLLGAAGADKETKSLIKIRTSSGKLTIQ